MIPESKRPWVKEEKHRFSHRSAPNDFYQSKEWKKTRNSFLIANPFCIECKKEGKKVPATVADHIKQVILDGEKHDWSNLQPLCSRHHNARSARQKNEMYKRNP